MHDQGDAAGRDEASLFHQGVRLFNAGDYFEAHEAWEAAWHQVAGETRDFYQGLIQCAVALEHVRRGNPRGALTVFERAQPRLEPYPSPYMGIDWRSLVSELSTLLAPLHDLPEDRLTPRKHGQSLPLDLRDAPHIELTDDPFVD